MKSDVLAEFNKMYKGDPSQTEAICEKIAKKFGYDAETVKDYVYVHRYEDDIDDDGIFDEEEENEDFENG